MDTVIKFSQMICWLGGAAMVLFFALGTLAEIWNGVQAKHELRRFRKEGEGMKRGNDE